MNSLAKVAVFLLAAMIVTPVNAEISGTGNLSAFELLAKRFNLKSSGVGNANINVANNLDVDISGTATVNYKGNPQIQQEISGVASLNRVE